MRCVGHVQRNEEGRGPRKDFEGKPEKGIIERIGQPRVWRKENGAVKTKKSVIGQKKEEEYCEGGQSHAAPPGKVG